MRKKYVYQYNKRGWEKGYIDVSNITSYDHDLGIEIGDLKMLLTLPTRVELYNQLIEKDWKTLMDVLSDNDYLVFENNEQVVEYAKDVV